MEATIRRAGPEDADALVALRAAMFTAIDAAGGDGTAWRTGARTWFADRLQPGGPLVVVVADLPDAGPVSCAAAELLLRAPSPGNPEGRAGHVSQVSTLPGHRRRGYARACLVELLRLLDADGVRRLDLHATADGEALYRSLGFSDPPRPALRRTTAP